MFFIEMQAKLAKFWLDAAQAGTRSVMDAWATAGHQGIRAWSDALGLPRPAPVFAFPWWPMPAPANPWLTAFNPPWIPGTAGWPFFGSGFDPMSFWGFPGFRATWTPAVTPASFAETIASSYRNATGHATASVIMAPMPGTPATFNGWWTWPMAGRG